MAFYPAPKPVPGTLRTSKLLLAPLTPGHVELDYAALMESRLELRSWSGTSWPADDFTLEENRVDLARHEREHHDREAFTYTVLTPHGDECLGCVYITPAAEHAEANPVLAEWEDGSALVDWWVRTSRLAEELDGVLVDALIDWLSADWQFQRVRFGAREGNARQHRLVAARLGFDRSIEVRRRGRYDLFA